MTAADLDLSDAREAFEVAHRAAYFTGASGYECRHAGLAAAAPLIAAQVAEQIARAMPFTDAEWREFQAIPDQGHSHRAWLDARAARIAREWRAR